MKIIIPGVVAGIATAALVSFAPVAHADTTQTVMVRPGGFDSALADTRTAGHVEFMKEGLHVWTTDTTSEAKAAQYVDVPAQALPTSASLTWYGTSPQPGSQIVFDADDVAGNGNDYNILVGEPVYGDDFWMTTGSTFYKQHHDLCPQTGGGFGSDCHGTLAEWRSALPNASVHAVGFSLGSGIKGDGLVHDIQVGTTDYQFTNEPEVTEVDVTGTETAVPFVKAKRTVVKVHYATDALGADQVQGRRLRFRIVADGEKVYATRMGAGEKALATLSFARGTGKHVVELFKGGVLDQTIKVKTGH